jgi:hypothetical protein
MVNLRLQSYAIEMVMQARDETKATFDSAQVNMQQFAMQGLRAATAARLATVGVEAITAMVRIGRGDWDALHETMKKMPLGIGQFHAALLELKDTYTGAREEAEKFAAKVERGIRWTDAAKGAQEFARAIQAQIGIIQAGGVEGQRLQAAEDARKERERFLAENKALLTRTVRTAGPPVVTYQSIGMGPPQRIERPGPEIETEVPVAPEKVPAIREGLEAIRWKEQWQLSEINKLEQQAAREKLAAHQKAAAADAKALLDQQTRAAGDKMAIMREIATRAYNATAEDFGRQLRALDDFYARQREQWKGHADVMAALQDAYAAERAAAFLAENERLADEWDEAWLKEGKMPAELSGLAGRASAPLLISRTLTGGAAANPVQQSNKILARIEDHLARMERKPGLDVTVEN